MGASRTVLELGAWIGLLMDDEGEVMGGSGLMVFLDQGGRSAVVESVRVHSFGIELSPSSDMYHYHPFVSMFKAACSFAYTGDAFG